MSASRGPFNKTVHKSKVVNILEKKDKTCVALVTLRMTRERWGSK